jgi:hypothetical protein
MKTENSQKKWANYKAILSIFGFSLIILPWIANFEPITAEDAQLPKVLKHFGV